MSLDSPSYKIKCLEGLLNKYGRDGMIYLNLGNVYHDIGDLHKALEMYENAFMLFPLPKYKQIALENIRIIKSKLQASTHVNASITGRDSEILYVVNCTKKKIWDLDPSAPPFVPAILAYQGPSFGEFLEFVNRKGIKWWLVLSARYGFIEPWHPIENYDISFDNPESGPITDDALRNQVLYQTRWNYLGSPRRLRDFKTVYVYGNIVYYEKTRKAFEGLAKVSHLKQLD